MRAVPRRRELLQIVAVRQLRQEHLPRWRLLAPVYDPFALDNHGFRTDNETDN